MIYVWYHMPILLFQIKLTAQEEVALELRASQVVSFVSLVVLFLPVIVKFELFLILIFIVLCREFLLM